MGFVGTETGKNVSDDSGEYSECRETGNAEKHRAEKEYSWTVGGEETDCGTPAEEEKVERCGGKIRIPEICGVIAEKEGKAYNARI